MCRRFRAEDRPTFRCRGNRGPVVATWGKIMGKLILLVRGVNVGGVKLPMAEFRQMLVEMGLTSVQTYIQSGNAVFDDPGEMDLGQRIGEALRGKFGLTPALFLLTAAEFDRVVAECPYAAHGAEAGTRVHVFFLEAPAMLDRAALEALATTEEFSLTPRAFYLHAPEGVGRSVLVEKLGQHLKAVTTARNWNTMLRLQEMLRA